MKILKQLSIVGLAVFIGTLLCNDKNYDHKENYIVFSTKEKPKIESNDYLRDPFAKLIYMIAISYGGNLLGRAAVEGASMGMDRNFSEKTYEFGGFICTAVVSLIDGILRRDFSPISRAIALAITNTPKFGSKSDSKMVS